METNEKRISNNIKSQIYKYGFSMGSLADKMGISRQALSRIINNPFKTNIKKLNIIATNIGCNIDDFFVPIEFTKSERKEL